MAQDDDKLAEIKKRYAYATERWRESYDLAREDRKFLVPGGQWDEAMRLARENDPNGSRPCLESPRLEQYIRQVVNDARQNTPQIKFRPTKEGSSKEVAEILNDIVRADQDSSNADSAFDQALEDGVRSSFGFFRILTDYDDDSSLNQRIKFKPARNPLCIYIDPDFSELDASDIRYAFVETKIRRERFKTEYPDADPVEFGDTYEDGWCDEETLRICEYFEVVEQPETLYFDRYGNATTKDAEGAVTRESVRREIKWYKLTGNEILEETTVPGEYIPIVPCFGRMLDVDGKLNLLSLIRPGKDAQRMYNYASSAMTERVTLSPKNKILASAESVEGYEDDYRKAHTSNDPLVRFKDKDSMGQPTQRPSMLEGQSNPQQWVALMQHANQDIQAAIGMYNASLGAKSNETSGRAILARQREGDVSTFDFIDNLARAVRLAGRIWLKMFCEITDTQRVIRTVSEDGTSGFVILDPEATEAYQEGNRDGEKVRIINPRIGQYDVTVVSGPSFTTKRDEAANFYTEVMRTAPNTAPALLPILMKQMDSPGADKAERVLKAMLPPNIQKAMDDDEGKQQVPPEVMAKMQQMEQALQQMQQALQEADQAKKEAELQVQEAEARAQRQVLDARNQAQQIQLKAATELSSAELEAQKIQIAAFEAETKRMQALQSGMSPDQIQALVMQTLAQLQTPGMEFEKESAQVEIEEPEMMESGEMEGEENGLQS